MNDWQPPTPIPVLVLAAGSARRFGSDKLLAEVAGQPLIVWTIEAVMEVVAVDHVLVLLAPGDEAKAELCDIAGVPTHVAGHADRGMRWTMRAGFDACPPEVPGAIFVLADDPLTVRALPGVLAAARRSPDRAVAVQRDPFVPHPVYLPRASWPDDVSVDPDHGLRSLLDDDCIWIEDPGIGPVDVDEPGDVDQLIAAMRSSMS